MTSSNPSSSTSASTGLTRIVRNTDSSISLPQGQITRTLNNVGNKPMVQTNQPLSNNWQTMPQIAQQNTMPVVPQQAMMAQPIMAGQNSFPNGNARQTMPANYGATNTAGQPMMAPGQMNMQQPVGLFGSAAMPNTVTLSRKWDAFSKRECCSCDVDIEYSLTTAQQPNVPKMKPLSLYERVSICDLGHLNNGEYGPHWGVRGVDMYLGGGSSAIESSVQEVGYTSAMKSHNKRAIAMKTSNYRFAKAKTPVPCCGVVTKADPLMVTSAASGGRQVGSVTMDDQFFKKGCCTGVDSVRKNIRDARGARVLALDLPHPKLCEGGCNDPLTIEINMPGTRNSTVGKAVRRPWSCGEIFSCCGNPTVDWDIHFPPGMPDDHKALVIGGIYKYDGLIL